MPLTLGNDLTGLVSREVDAAGNKASGLGASLTTGNDTFVEVVDAFLGNSLRDGEIVLGAVAKNTAYSINLLTITDEYLKIIATSLQDGLKTIASAGALSTDNLDVLQKNLNDKRTQVALLINTADFDGKGLLKGDAQDLQVQVGLNVTDRLAIKVNDINNGKLFRTSAANLLNKYLSTFVIGKNTYYASQTEIDADLARNINLINVSISNAGGSGTGGGHILASQFGAAIVAARAGNTSFETLSHVTPLFNDDLKQVFINRVNANPAITNPGSGTAAAAALLAGGSQTAAAAAAVEANELAAGRTAIQALAARNAYITLNTGVTLQTASANLLDRAIQATTAAGHRDLWDSLKDDQSVNLENNETRILAQDVFTAALGAIRTEQAAVSNQKSNVVGAADALRATTNVTQKAADSYLKTDYVLTAQQYSETIRTMVAAITALQASNKIPEAAQRLIDALAR